nr:hypothetical protein [uncultured bacterium]
MLRVWMRAGLVLMALFTGIGLVVSKAWGWSEYASDDLYVVYASYMGITSYFSVKVNDAPDEGALLTWDKAEITALDCSPDGRRLAILTDTGHVGIVTAAGMVENTPEDQGYDQVSVANDGTVALFNMETGDLRIGTTTMNLPVPAQQISDNFIDMASQGFALWEKGVDDTELLSLASGEVVLSLPFTGGGQWLASENIFAFNYGLFSDEDAGKPSGWYLADAATHETVRINEWSISSPFSPDGTKTANVVILDGLQQREQIGVFGAFAPHDFAQARVLTSNPDISHFPLCFLTFRPQRLIGASP